MFVSPPEVGRAPSVTVLSKFRELGNGNSKASGDAAQARLAGPLVSRGHLLQEIAAKGIICSAHGTIGFSYQLRDDMPILNSVEKIYHNAELLIGSHLLESRLGQPSGVRFVIGVWTTEYLDLTLAHPFTLDDRTMALILTESETVGPARLVATIPQDKTQSHVGLSAGGKGSDRRDPPALRQGRLETATNSDDVVEESQSVEKVGFS
jgi:hypothetical protein